MRISCLQTAVIIFVIHVTCGQVNANTIEVLVNGTSTSAANGLQVGDSFQIYFQQNTLLEPISINEGTTFYRDPCDLDWGLPVELGHNPEPFDWLNGYTLEVIPAVGNVTIIAEIDSLGGDTGLSPIGSILTSTFTFEPGALNEGALAEIPWGGSSFLGGAFDVRTSTGGLLFSGTLETVSLVPEPSLLSFCVSGMLAFAASRRRCRGRASSNDDSL